MNTDLRTLSATEWDSWLGCIELAFGGVPLSPESRELYAALAEPQRALGLWDGAECVGTAGAYSFRLTVPGGAAVAGRGDHDGERRLDAPQAGPADVDDAAPAGRRPLVG